MMAPPGGNQEHSRRRHPRADGVGLSGTAGRHHRQSAVRTGDMGNRLTGNIGDTKPGGYALEDDVTNSSKITTCEPGRERPI